MAVSLVCGLAACDPRHDSTAAAGCPSASASPSTGDAGALTGEHLRVVTPPRQHVEPGIKGVHPDKPQVMLSSCELWTVPDRTHYLHWDGSSGRTAAKPAASWVPGGAEADVQAMAAAGATDVWSVGSYLNDQGGEIHAKGLVDHYDGRRWQAMEVPAADGYQLTAVAAPGNGTAWVLAAWNLGLAPLPSGQPTAQLLHWDGHAWSRHPVPLPAESLVEDGSLSAAGADDVWFGGFVTRRAVGTMGDLLMHWDGTRWRQVPYSARKENPSVLADGAGGVWVAAGGSSALDRHGVETRSADGPVFVHRTRTGTVTTVPVPPAPSGWWTRFPPTYLDKRQPAGYATCGLGDFFREPGTARVLMVETCRIDDTRDDAERGQMEDYDNGEGSLVLSLE
ncbi:MAG: hypothetical protein ACJ73S_31375 [Mycobacteriales bacterium]